MVYATCLWWFGDGLLLFYPHFTVHPQPFEVGKVIHGPQTTIWKKGQCEKTMFYQSELGTMLIFQQIRFFRRNSTWRHAKLPSCLGHFVLNHTLELWGIKTNTCTYCNESYILTHPRKYMEDIPHVHFIYIATLLYSNVAGKSKIRGELFIKTSI